MPWDYGRFPCYPVAAEGYLMIGRNTNPSHNHYDVYHKLGKSICTIIRITCACPAFVSQPEKECVPNSYL